jgi:superfamily II DNA or RNA helicase
MMLNQVPSIRHRLYRLPRDPLVADVLIPAFANAREIRGAFGWFSSAWLATVAHGLAHFISARDRGRIQMVIAPSLFATDKEFLEALVNEEQWVSERIGNVVAAASGPSADALERHAVECMGWMIAAGLLDLRVAIPKSGGNYHPKIWLFDDGEHQVLVRGSANATERALGSGIEHMDVDCSWIDPERVLQSRAILDDWTAGHDEQLQAVLPLPIALKQALVAVAPPVPPSIHAYESACATTRHTVSASLPASSFAIPVDRVWDSGRFKHQGEAVRAWEAANGCGLIEMATGAGKTVTALVCAQRLHLRSPKPLAIVISAPTIPLVEQWSRACREFGVHTVTAGMDSTISTPMAYANALHELKGRGAPAAIAFPVTNFRVASAEFQELFKKRGQLAGIDVLHIGDEAHTLGATRFRQSDRDFARYRLGLSATPMRQFDELGTEKLLEYFGKIVYQFGLARAIGVCLVPYKYSVHRAFLAGEELEEFLELSSRIGRAFGAASAGDASEIGDALTALLIRRRSITECATDKFRTLAEVVVNLSRKDLTLVYTSSKRPSQMEQAIGVLAKLGVSATRITEAESADRKQFDAIISNFVDGVVDVIVAKKVLDEGVDIPQVRQAIFLASSSVEREWIQRRGRILRVATGKPSAHIHDILCLPPPRTIKYPQAVISFISAELDRVRAFARDSMNPDQASQVIEAVHADYYRGDNEE